MKKLLILSIFIYCLPFHIVYGQNSDAITTVMRQVSPDAIKGHMTFLADDLLEGRQPGTRGFSIGSKYIESQFISLGLQPGISSSYIQKVPLQKSIVEENESYFVIKNGNSEEKLIYGQHFLLNPYFTSAISAVNAPLVFVGFGISAPELQYDDYQNINVKGKIVVYLRGAPNTFPNDESAYYGSPDSKYKEAIKRGAVGVITFSQSTTRPGIWDAMVTRFNGGAFKWTNSQSVPANNFEALKSITLFNNAYVEKLFVNAPETLQKIYELAAKGKSLSFPLKLSASIQVKTNSKSIESSNVVGILEGSDPLLKNEYVVYTAHLDHLGMGVPVQNDSIYNGAHDNASGTAILLEIIKTYRSLPVKPKRSVIFTIVTGEESGLLGSDYFVNNPPMQNGKIIANLAIDMPFFFHPVLDIVPYGADHSSLGLQTEKAAKILGLKISPDPFPEQVIFTRSDHYSFITKGIPALFIKSGFMTVPQDTVDRAKSDVAWRKTIYHSPQDDMNQLFDFDAATMHVKINFLIGYFVCNENLAPEWNKDDFFGQKFNKK